MASCNFNASYTNRANDKAEGERVTRKFYSLLKKKRFEETYPLFSPRFMQVTDTAHLNTIYRTTLEKLGNVEGRKLQDWQTTVIKGTASSSGYVFVYDVKREQGNSTETIRLEKEGDEIKILALDIRSDKL